VSDVARFEARALRDSGKALLCKIEEDVEVWIPKSQIDDDSEVYEEGHEGTLVIPLWLAEAKDLA
jgi:hypothetical protein